MEEKLNLITESVFDVQHITENDTSGRKNYIVGPFLMAEAKNRNGRFYSRAVLEKTVDDYRRDWINEGRSVGELNHPNYPKPDISKAALMTKSLEWDKNDVVGKAVVVDAGDNSPGRILLALMESGFKMGVSSRGLGTQKQRSDRIDVGKYMLTAIDAVDRPSGQTCYVDRITESLMYEYVEVNGVYQLVNESKDESNILRLNNNLDRLIEVNKNKWKLKI